MAEATLYAVRREGGVQGVSGRHDLGFKSCKCANGFFRSIDMVLSSVVCIPCSTSCERAMT
eukprot:719033-Rhodomonas_salina.1